MNIKEKMNLKFEGLVNEGPINIVAFGDSVTHGAVAAGMCVDLLVSPRLLGRVLEYLLC